MKAEQARTNGQGIMNWRIVICEWRMAIEKQTMGDGQGIMKEEGRITNYELRMTANYEFWLSRRQCPEPDRCARDRTQQSCGPDPAQSQPLP
jgi:hypothetical protein